MNVWKVATAALTAGVIVLGGKVAFNSADAAPSGASKSTVENWGQRQPLMLKALEALNAARRDLERASEHKGGWRVLALKHTDEAIVETNRGMEYAKNHPDE